MRYSVIANITISVSTDVEADSEEQARELALERGVQGLCHHCASADGERQWVAGGELDGQPSFETIVDVVQHEGREKR